MSLLSISTGIDTIPNFKISIETIIPFIASSTIIFFGINKKNVRSKEFRLTNILILYVAFYLIFIFNNGELSLLLLSLSTLAGSIILLKDENNNLENELNVIQLSIYNIFSWFFLSKNYILWVLYFSLSFVSNNSNTLFITLIIFFALLYHYTSIAKDFFDFYQFQHISEKLGLNSKEENNNRDINLDLLSFLMFMEDKNMFNKKRIFYYKQKAEYNEAFPSDFKFNDPTSNFKETIKKFKRGYSNIEQQYIRSFALKDYSYRYLWRRKIFVEYIYKYFFKKAVCRRRALSYPGSYKQKKKIHQDLKNNLKYFFLTSYYLKVLENPESIQTLINAMAKQSRVSESLYRDIYSHYKGSDLQIIHKNQIIDAENKTHNFYKHTV